MIMGTYITIIEQNFCFTCTCNQIGLEIQLNKVKLVKRKLMSNTMNVRVIRTRSPDHSQKSMSRDGPNEVGSVCS